MLKEFGVTTVIIGHSERRLHLAENNEVQERARLFFIR